MNNIKFKKKSHPCFGELANQLWKAGISFLCSACLPARMLQLDSHHSDFYEVLQLGIY
jgi:hypothetical protein